MRAQAVLTCGPDGLGRLHSEPPLSLRPAADGVYLVGSAGGPIGGDDLALDVRVDGAALRLRSTAAQVVLPGRDGEPSRSRLRAHVGCDARLDIRFEPTVLVRGCHHVTDVAIDVEPGGALVWADMVVFGRSGEQGGTATSRLRVVVGEVPLIHHELDVHPSSIDGARVVGFAALLAPDWAGGPPPAIRLGPSAWWLPADGPGGTVLALGGSVSEVADAFACAIFEPALASRSGRIPLP